jgi:hypothetical protein
MLSLEDLTEEQLKRIKATFAALSDSPGDAQRKLVEASEQLGEAGAKVEQAQRKVLDATENAMQPARAHDKANAA